MATTALFAQNSKKIEVGTKTTNSERRDATERTTSNTSKTSITWRFEGEKWKIAKRPGLPGVSDYLSKYESSNQYLTQSKKQFKIGLIGTGAVYTGITMTFVGSFIEPESSTQSNKPSFLNPLTISGIALAVGGAAVGTIFKTKGLNTLKKSAKAYNDELSKSSTIRKQPATYSCAIGSSTSLLGLSFNVKF